MSKVAAQMVLQWKDSNSGSPSYKASLLTTMLRYDVLKQYIVRMKVIQSVAFQVGHSEVWPSLAAAQEPCS